MGVYFSESKHGLKQWGLLAIPGFCYPLQVGGFCLAMISDREWHQKQLVDMDQAVNCKGAASHFFLRLYPC